MRGDGFPCRISECGRKSDRGMVLLAQLPNEMMQDHTTAICGEHALLMASPPLNDEIIKKVLGLPVETVLKRISVMPKGVFS